MSLDKVNLDENGNPTDDRMQAPPQPATGCGPCDHAWGCVSAQADVRCRDFAPAAAFDKLTAAPPQESDKGRENGEDISLDDLPAYIATLERQLAEARAEVEALREEVALTNEHEHQILQERNAARDELQTARDAYAELLQETKLTEEVMAKAAAMQPARREEWIVSLHRIHRRDAERIANLESQLATANVSTDRSGEAGKAASLRADAIRSKAMRGEPITDAERCLLAWDTSSATDRASFERGWEARRGSPADVVPVPREELDESLRKKESP